MKTSKRFDRAIKKLYTAFHENTLNPECCYQCAVGNICDNTDTWKYLTEAHGSNTLSELGRLNERFGRRVFGYRPSELLRIETAFLEACGYEVPFQKSKNEIPSKDVLFDGLVAAVAVLCDIENIPRVMDCDRLFDYSKTKPQEETAFIEI